MKNYLLLLYLTLSCAVNAQIPHRETLNAIDDLTEFIAIPNFGLDTIHIQENIEWISKQFQKRNFRTSVLETSGNPLFFAEMEIDPKLPTMLFYMHLDGQAVDNSKWNQANPYKAVLKIEKEGQWIEVPTPFDFTSIDPDWRIFGRSASDDKGPIIAFLHSLDAIERENKKPQYNVKVILDTEEEIGSKPLAEAVKQHREILSADALIINDGPVHISGRPTINFGCRGIMTANLTIYGPIKPQHSGHYGNYAPNPIFRMAKLLSSMKDDDGRVLIKGYYDGIQLDNETKQILANVPDDPKLIHELLQINQPEKVGENYQEALQYPSLNARGIVAGWVGKQARTIVPDNATVAIDIRLVPESDPSKLVEAMKNHIINEGYHIVDHEPTFEERMKHPKILFLYTSKATLPFRTDMGANLGKWVEGVIRTEYNEDPVKIRIMGGTVPIASFINELDIPAVIVPMVNPDNNQHSPNENLRIGHLQNAILLFKALLDAELKL